MLKWKINYKIKMILQEDFIIILVYYFVFHNQWTYTNSEATGAAMTPSTFKRYVNEAGFSKIDALPIEHFIWKFYRLSP